MRRVPLRAVPPPNRSDEPGYRVWHSPAFGRCAVCDQPGRLVRHHVVLEQHLRAMGAPAYDLRNALDLGMHCRCHSQHHNGARRIPVSKVPDDAIAYASELLGDGVGAYLSRYYSPR